ncbi:MULTISPECIES: substrate-binding domain-containing protein [unclassified Burkholderia]|uniref:substrate-binding domain-containing protein n=1 Tax=unclassified Burkholderia TaxID=2613784 RepID=UPI002AAFAD8F|nr:MULTISPECIES: substrate-binding domain-containing protein [unclassified Burkholderia]
MLNKIIIRYIAAAAVCYFTTPSAVFADTATQLMQSRLGTSLADPVVTDSFQRAARPLTDAQRAKALQCWKANGCTTGTGGKLSVAYADGFGENVWRRVTEMEFIQQALTYPEIGKIQYSSARGDVSKAISDLNSYIAQGVNVIVLYADSGAALAPTVREAREAGITVVLNNGTEAGAPGKDYPTSVHENICALGQEFVNTIVRDNPSAKSVVALGGTPGNTISSEWQNCATKQTSKLGLKILTRIDTNWTQEGTFQAISAALSQYGNFDGWLYEYADGFRAALRAYKAAGRPINTVVTLRTDEQGLFCDWESLNNPNFRIYYSSGGNFTARISLTAAMMVRSGAHIPSTIYVPFSMKPARKGLCNRDLPMETSLSTLVDPATLKAMFPK